MPRVLFLVVLLAMLLPQGVAAQLYQVGQIVIDGNRRVESRYIESLISVTAGQTVSAADIDRDLRSIYATGRFSDVSAETVTAGEGLSLVYRVVERPLLREVKFTGNQEIDTEKLATIISAKEIGFFRPQVLAPAVRKIQQAYVLEVTTRPRLSPRSISTTATRLRLLSRSRRVNGSMSPISALRGTRFSATRS
ncbi:MAG: POTRA domain-containing protein [Syntrophotaleaceae bacterium]